MSTKMDWNERGERGMTEHDTTPAAIAMSSGSVPESSDFADLTPDVQADQYRRLGSMGLVYAGAWLAVFVYYQLGPYHNPNEREVFWYSNTALCIMVGFAVYWLCRKRWIPPRRFAGFAFAFEILGGFGIMAGAFGWEQTANQVIGLVARAFGITGDLYAGVTVPLEHERVRLFYSEGVPWVSVWLLVFPLVVPFSMRRTILATLLTAATVPVTLIGSLWLHGMPPALAPWAWPYIIETSIPAFICAGIAIFGARIVYNLTRDLSKARRMGSYRLLEKIGAGGMGEVWKAKHRLLVRPAAIKLIRRDAFGPESAAAESAMKRFEREAQATAKLASPHTVDLYDFGIANDGTFYYVMELLEGIDLRTFVERFGVMPPERAIHVLRQACHSLLDAHEQGLVHRDIKPANVFVCRRGPDYDFVKVLDFGLVKELTRDGARGGATIEGIASGTPTFMAPEMASGEHPVDGRSDLYALGCVGYWVLTGTLVFEGETAVAILLKHARDEPPPFSRRTQASIPADLEKVILECLRKNPNERPQTARELSDRLAACGRSLPAWTEERARAWWIEHEPQHEGAS